jgi:pyruvate formate lyase activating enzyme
LACLGQQVPGNSFFALKDKWMREAMFYIQTPRGVKCLLCPNECVVKNGELCICHNRVAKDDRLYTIGYGNPCGVNADPVEKKPLYHFLPSSVAFSIGVAGYNFACLNCLNYQISQVSPHEVAHFDLMPDEVIQQTVLHKCTSIAYTYTEPVTFYEYTFDTAVLARQAGMKNILVSNGYISEEPLRKLSRVLDAASIDLKSFSEDTYARLNAGKLQPVLNTLKILKEEGVWVEVSNLVIPGWSDDPEMIRRMCDWLAKTGFQDHPLHFIRFLPMYKLTDVKQTPFETMVKVREIAQSFGFMYVYIGNIPGEEQESTFCPKCKKPIIIRSGFSVKSNHVVHGKCKWCGAEIKGVWS